MSMLKGKKGIYIVFLFMLMFIVCKNTCYGYEKSVITDTFPKSYQSYIDKIKKEHPTWILKAFYTKLDWNTVLNSEASGTYSRIQNSAYGDAWKRIESSSSSSYNAAGFVLASRAAVAYTLDPRNSLNDEGIFQFRVIDQNVNSDTEKAVNEITYKTPMYNAKIGDKTYSSVIQKVGIDKKIAPTFIVSRIRQETACNIINNGSINGKNEKYPGYYNFFNIGAVDGSGAVQAGINLAYSMGWNTQEKAIAGGMDWLNNKYVKYGQNTVYFQKFDVANPYGNATVMLKSQYMTNILAPMGEAKIAYNGLVRADALDKTYTFYIPIYDNMPATASPVPTTGYYKDDSTMVYLDDPSDNLADTFKIRSSADSSSDSNVVHTIKEPSDVSKKTIMLRTKKGIETGWDYVEFEVNGKKVEGYIWNSYVYDYSYTKVSGVTLNNNEMSLKVGESSALTATIAPTNAKYKDVTWSSSNTKVATVDATGNVKAIAAGSAIITVKTKDQAKTATCVVNVTDKNPSISLDKEKYTVLKDNSVEYITTIVDSDIKDYDIKIENENIAKIENDKIIGVSVGETKLTVTIKGTEIKTEAAIKVIDIKEGDIVIDDSLNVSDDIITKVESKTKVVDIVDKITTNHQLELKNISGNKLNNEDFVGTGTTINIKNDKDEIIYTYKIIIYGDVDGNSIVDSMDMYKTIQHILKNKELQDEFLKAGDTNSDSKIDSMDMYNIIQIILKK